jgi:methylated-DNA-[protein]-cysteine S-methyltransferase
LIQIPYGTTASYLELSKNIGNEKAVRAVASANGANAISILIPCHRIIGSNGDLVGYAGGLPVKKKLLELESNLFT